MRSIFLLLMAVLIMSCGKRNEPPSLYLKSSSIKSFDNNEVRKDTLTKVTSDYLEVALYPYDEGYYKAKKELENFLVQSNAESSDGYIMKFYFVTDSLGEEIEFKNPDEFLIFMSERGYGLVRQNKYDYRIDYIFTRKPEKE